MNLADAAALIEAFRAVAPRKPDRPTIMELSGYPHWETVCSNLLAFFLDPSSPHGLDTLCLDALLDAAGLAGERPSLSDVVVEREALTNAGNRLDILVTSDSHVVAIENKILASVNNPLADYAALAAKASEGRRTVVKILLAIFPPPAGSCYGFVWVSYEDFFQLLRDRLGQQGESPNARYNLYLEDFMTTINNLKRGTQMDPALLGFLCEHVGDVTRFLGAVRSFEQDLHQQVTKLKGLVEVTSQGLIKEVFFWKRKDELADSLVYDINASRSLTVRVETIITPAGWRIQFGNWDDQAGLAPVRELLEKLRVPFVEPQVAKRLLYPETFNYGALIEVARSHLQPVINALVSASDHSGGATLSRPVAS